MGAARDRPMGAARDRRHAGLRTSGRARAPLACATQASTARAGTRSGIRTHTTIGHTALNLVTHQGAIGGPVATGLDAAPISARSAFSAPM
jgi:hypothetical protein